MLREQLGKNGSTDYGWQLAQGWLYTEGLQFAKLSPGSFNLCNYLTQHGYQLYIVSHKTSHTPDYCGHIPLHNLANNWIAKSLISNYFIEPGRVYFEPTRKAKVKRIRELSLSYFVDDLLEVLLDEHFPPETTKVLLSNETYSNLPDEINAVSSFRLIKEILEI